MPEKAAAAAAEAGFGLKAPDALQASPDVAFGALPESPLSLRNAFAEGSWEVLSLLMD
ncbi:hypothetical protein MMPV_005984 [Pyropia vietnamensis]